MARSELIDSRLEDEEVVASVDLSGDDQLLVTPTRSLLYRAEGLISDESVEEFPHEARRVTLDRGRRKVKLGFEYPIQDSRTMSVPEDVLDSVLHYVLAGVLNATGVTVHGEVVRRVFRFNEMTLVITDRRLVIHVGAALWGEEYDEFGYDNLAGIEFEESSVAIQVVLYTEGRSQRIKAPQDRGEELKQELTSALLTYFDVDDLAALDDMLGDDEEEIPEGGEEPGTTGLNLGGGIDPLDAGGQQDTESPDEVSWPNEASDDGRSDGAREPAKTGAQTDPGGEEGALRDALEQLETAIDEQQQLLAAQADAVETIAEILDRDGW